MVGSSRYGYLTTGSQPLQVLAIKFGNPMIRYLVGDIRDESRVDLAMEDVDYVFHAPP